jgi:hypothetical protein
MVKIREDDESMLEAMNDNKALFRNDISQMEKAREDNQSMLEPV